MEWSEMFRELLVVIAQKHIVFYEDYPSFAGVCKSWHSAAVEVASKYRLPSRFPSLLLAETTEDDEFREVFLLSNESTHKIRLPEAYGKFCTSSRGWLATEGGDYAVKLVHPLSRETINLPSINTLPHVSLKTMHKGIWKLLLVPSMEIVVVVWGGSGKLGFCRPGDNKWTPVLNGCCWRIEDMTYYNDRVYTFNTIYHIQTCDIYGANPTEMVNVSGLPEDLYYDGRKLEAYILGLDDDDGRKRLLVIIKETRFDDDELCKKPSEYMTEGFTVFGYDLQSETWSKVKDLGKKTLFVGYNSSFWIEDTTEMVKGNCVYYTDEYAGGRDMGIYHMSDGTIEPHYGGESLGECTPPIWLQSI